MAEALFNSRVREDEVLAGEYTASSAGVSAFEGEPASPMAVEVLQKKWGIDLREHEAQRLSYELVDRAFLILTMTGRHKEMVTGLFPEMHKKVFTLKEYAISKAHTENDDITDPFGGDYEVYEKCAEEIKDQVDMLTHILSVIANNGTV
jgi:protein-tyrosine phosphatase